MMEQKSSTLFGYWLFITDADSASAAAKMSGLPILVFGLSLMIVSTHEIAESTGSLNAVNLIIGILGLLLCRCAFRIRSGHHAWLPFVLFPMLGIMAANTLLATNTIGVDATPTKWMSQAVGVLLIILALSGLRGWLWKRRNRVAMRF
jgi:hypothetical protein